MSQATPPTMPAGAPNDPKRSGAGAAPQQNAAGIPAQRPNTTTPKAPEVGASAPRRPVASRPTVSRPRPPPATPPRSPARPPARASVSRPVRR